MDLKFNINKIHSLLMSKYENVLVYEKSSIKYGNYFEIVVKENLDLRIILPYKNLDNKSNINWEYYSNPLDENSFLIERSSYIDKIIIDIDDIFLNKRFSEDYLKNN